MTGPVRTSIVNVIGPISLLPRGRMGEDLPCLVPHLDTVRKCRQV